MRSFFVLLLIGSTFYLNAQKRVTDYIGPPLIGKTMVQEVDGVNYVLFINQNGDVHVHIWEEDGTLRHVRTKNVQGVNSYLSAIHDRYLVTATITGFRMYNFVDGSHGGISASFDDGAIFTKEFIHMNQGEVLFMGKYNNTGVDRYFYMSTNFLYEHIPEGLKGLFLKEGMVFCSRTVNNIQEYSLFFPQTQTLQPLFGNTERSHGVFIQDQQAWYLNEDLDIIRFDAATKKQRIYPIAPTHDELNNSLVILGEEALVLQASGDSLFTEFFNLKTLQKTREIKSKLSGIPDIRYTFLLDSNHLLLRTNQGVVGSLDLETENLASFPCNKDYVFYDWPILDATNIVLPFENQMRICNLLNGSYFESTTFNESFSTWSPTYILHQQDFYTSAFHKDASLPNLFKINTGSSRIEPSNIFDSYTPGLPIESRLFKTEDGAWVSGKNVYVLEKQNAAEIIPSENKGTDLPYAVFQNELYQTYTDDSSLYLIRIEGKNKTVLLKLKKPQTNLQYWVVTDNYFYYADRTHFWYRVPLSGGDPLFLPALANLPTYSFNAIEDNFFFFKDKSIYQIKNDGSVQTFFTNADVQKWRFVRMGDQLFLLTPKVIYFWQNGVFIPKIENLNPSSTVHSNTEHNHLLIWSIEGKNGLFWKQDSFHIIPELPFSLLPLRPIQYLERQILFSDGYTQHFIYDIGTNSWSFIKDIPTNINIDGVLTMSKDTFLVGHQGENIFTFRLTENFTISSPISSIVADGYITSTSVKSNQNFGLFQTDKFLYYINSQGTLFKLENLFSSPETQYQTLLNDDGSLYFFALEHSWGRQVYLLEKVEKWEEPEPEKPEVPWVLFPNPTLHTIYISGLKNESFQYYITDEAGRLLESNSSFSISIDVSRFYSGLYYIKIIQGNKNKVFPFIKI